jgi:antitoxin VapB
VSAGSDVRGRVLDRIWGSVPWMKLPDRQRFRVKVFKSGNSLALRLPANLGFKAGMEMDLNVENGQHFSFEIDDLPKRKFNVAKVCGSATSLQPIADDDRQFEERPLAWPGTGEPGEPA